MLDLILGIALLVSNVGWWIYVRHLSGVTSDLKDVAADVHHAAHKVSTAANQIKAKA